MQWFFLGCLHKKEGRQLSRPFGNWVFLTYFLRHLLILLLRDDTLIQKRFIEVIKPEAMLHFAPLFLDLFHGHRPLSFVKLLPAGEHIILFIPRVLAAANGHTVHL